MSAPLSVAGSLAVTGTGILVEHAGVAAFGWWWRLLSRKPTSGFGFVLIGSSYNQYDVIPTKDRMTNVNLSRLPLNLVPAYCYPDHGRSPGQPKVLNVNLWRLTTKMNNQVRISVGICARLLHGSYHIRNSLVERFVLIFYSYHDRP